jgi:hypothetical protein
LLEKASLENLRDKKMIDLWANLLASAALDDDSNVPRYVSILSEINGRQARLLEKIMMIHNLKHATMNAERVIDNLWSAEQGNIIYNLEKQDSLSDPELIIEMILDELHTHGVLIDTIMVGHGADQWDWSGFGAGKPFIHVDKHRLDIDILESLNLLKDMSFKFVKFREFDISALYFQVTPVAIDLLAACNPHLLERRRKE